MKKKENTIESKRMKLLNVVVIMYCRGVTETDNRVLRPIATSTKKSIEFNLMAMREDFGP